MATRNPALSATSCTATQDLPERGVATSSQQPMSPDVGAAGAGIGGNAENVANAMVLETSRQDVRRAIATCVGDKNDRPVVLSAPSRWQTHAA